MNNIKENLIKELLEKKANENNKIDLEAYALGLDDMYESIQKLKLN